MAAPPSRFSPAGRIHRPSWVILIALSALFMYRWLGSSLPLSPGGESQIEIGYLWMLRRLWAQGDGLRGWNPYLLSGVPTATSGAQPLLLALAALSHLLGLLPETLFRWTEWLATFLSGLGTYLYIRHLPATSSSTGSAGTGGSPAAATAAAMVFAFFPVRIMLTAESVAVACIWAALPWTFWGYERIRHPFPLCWRSTMVWALTLTWIALIDPQWLAVLLPILALYIALRELCGGLATRQAVAQPPSGLAGLSVGSRSSPSRVRTLAMVIPVTAVLVIALSLCYVLPRLVERELLWMQPAIEGLPDSVREPVPLGLWTSWLLQRWSPGFAPMAWDLAHAFPNITWYLGVIPCLLAIMGLLRVRHWPRTLPLLGVFGAGMLLTAGPTIPANPAYVVLARIPWLSQSLKPALSYVWPASLALAALAGLGVDGLSQILGMDWRASAIGQLAVGLAIVALILFDFWPATEAYGVVHSYLERDEIEAHLWLNEAPGEERYWVPFQSDRPGRRYTDTSYGIRYNRRPSISVNEYYLQAAPYRAAFLYGRALQWDTEGRLSQVRQSILDLANVRYLLLHLESRRSEEALTALSEDGGWHIVRRDQHIALFENLRVRPYAHAYAGGAYSATWDDAELLENLPWLLARGYALVEAQEKDVNGLLGQGRLLQPFEAQPPQAWPSLGPPEVDLAMARPQATEIWIRFEAESPFLLMISETWYPHWRVYVNGAQQPLLRLNGNYAGVYVDTGDGYVQFRYRRPWYVWLGWAVSALTSLVLLASVLRPQPVRLRPDV